MSPHRVPDERPEVSLGIVDLVSIANPSDFIMVRNHLVSCTNCVFIPYPFSYRIPLVPVMLNVGSISTL